MRPIRTLALAGLAVCLAAPAAMASAQAATDPTHFSVLATLAPVPGDLSVAGVNSTTSPQAGVLYVTGTDNQNPGSVRLDRVLADGTVAPVAITAPTDVFPQVVSAGGQTWLMTESRLFRIDGLTATEVAVPAPPGVTSWRLTGIAAQGADDLWIGGNTGTAGYGAHFDGTSWTFTDASTGPTTGEGHSLEGRFFLDQVVPSTGRYTVPVSTVQSTTGSVWQSEPGSGSYDFWTGTSLGDYTKWGSLPNPVRLGDGACERVVNGAVAPAGCIAPSAGVVGAVQAADGEVVLATGSQSTTMTNPAFWLVPTPGATPVPFPVSAPDAPLYAIQGLAVSPGSSELWAVTYNGSALQVQHADLAGSTPAPSPTTTTPVPSPTTTTPVPSPTTTTPVPSPTTTTPAPTPSGPSTKGPKSPKPTKTPKTPKPTKTPKLG